VIRRSAAKKSLGQHFLVDREVLADIVDALEVVPGDRVLEIGPGHGVLTRALLDAGASITAVELDPELAGSLRETLPGVRVIEGDILSIQAASLFEGEPYKVAGNIPYYISSPILRHVLEPSPKPSRVVLMLQKELAERVVAAPGDMSLLSVSVQVYGRASIVRTVPASAFSPRPKVESALVRIEVYEQPAVSMPDVDRFFAIVRAGFAERRKQVHNALQRNYKPAGAHTKLTYPPADILRALEACSIEPTRRAETLTLHEWGCVVDAISRLPAPVLHV
jgi:16S rRNA (adenine1518-N6/adenine1519-N6)-dimethyltransferase